MSRIRQPLRASITVGAFLLAFGALHSAQAADAPVQRLAMACTHGSDAGCKPAPMRAPSVGAVQRAEMAADKATARRTQESRTASRDSDGSRFAYDSCGCSN